MNHSSPRPEAGPAWPRGLPWLLAGLAMFGPFTIDTIFPAFVQMGQDLRADKVAMQQTISVYLFAYALMSVVHGPLSDAIGRRRVILGGLVVFTLASAGCAIAPDLGTLLVFRAAQGLSAGVGVVVGRAVIRDLYDGPNAQRLLSQVSMIFGIAPAIAPLIGGWILGWARWPAIFWFLVLFSLALLLATWRWLPETLPPPQRRSLAPRSLLRDYLGIFRNARFGRLAVASAFNFAALFLFIASAPAFVMGILGLGERQFGWFFIPMISGMMTGAWVSGRAAGRIRGITLANIGFACSAVAIAANILYYLLVDDPTVPWAVLPLVLNSFGIALVFPIVTLAILDMFPAQRGAAASLQAFTGLMLNAVIAGVLSPLVSATGFGLASLAASFLVIGWIFWRWETRTGGVRPKIPTEPAALEPTDHL
ncbi:MAG: multidrug effflux MFS transporter [Gammaproteobacteria bacterium]|nr:multidrug effflux MFS transporter [Gammaproteobacteria bacterium]